MDKTVSAIVTIATAIIGVAILAVLVSKNANTSNVIKSAGGAFSNSILAAVSPIMGGSMNNANGFTPIF